MEQPEFAFPSYLYHFDGCWTPQGWLQPAYLGVNLLGCINYLKSVPPRGFSGERVHGYALPGFYNAHSHAFQYAMAGTAEHLPANAHGDDFWSWRENMYQLALHLTPSQVEAIATMLYAKMLHAGYTHVVEFHYLHHRTNGAPYQHRAEMAERILRAAQIAGINITLIPIFYQQGGFGQKANPRQRRFLCRDIDEYVRLWEECHDLLPRYRGAKIGVGVHSLRAVTAEDTIRAFSAFPVHYPRHIHAAEQRKEVEDCVAHLGVRPVQWLLDHLPLDSTYHIVHATHTEPSELQRLGQSGASVVLCPSTEGNLGDGRFDLVTYRQARGSWCIGTDSHISIFPNEELRLLDYHQRMAHYRRNILCQQPGENSGTIAFQESWIAGRAAAGLPPQPCGFALGQPLDAIIYSSQHPHIATTPASQRLSTIIYACDTSAILGTMVWGEWVVRRHWHIRYDAILEKYIKAVQDLKTKMASIL